jgi:alpha-methylacyl-CoA racemase
MGPLHGTKIIELAGLGAGPFCGMMLADMGAEVIRIERPGSGVHHALDPLLRNRKSIACDLKNPRAIDLVLQLVETADGLFEGFRPGVAERLGLGPDACRERNAKLVYGRVTGWGQDGPLANAAGHDLNYIALSGALHLIGRPGQKPVPPLNLIGDFGGGGMLLAFGMVCAMLHAQRTGVGQVVDAAMIDGTNALMAMFHGFRAMGLHSDDTGSSFLGGAAHFYDTYETRDGKYVSIAAIEPKFYDLLIERCGLDRNRFAPGVFRMQSDDRIRALWAELKAELTVVFKTKTRDQWCEILEGTDACFAPVLTLTEALAHAHNRARDAFISVGGQSQAAPAPRFSHSPADTPRPGVTPGTHNREVLQAAGFTGLEIDQLVDAGAIVNCQ